ncbi:hypothetical protein EPA93_40705 [Ktedonosporobacter rubrisoli]|uniref:Long-chain fatty acid--CoA ligase n=1 Tax=Ktedonosporobacter rubrisoli TaxID=2509675 RepID=A0A4P6K1V4_KTERU|nr:class I adenylate-forming enzyme family protein [Ktedonosporobacter rubrisoli]QBD81965.1 hypothetical protein EPA93_40705 [Ktedonosporobacter rubrisoli]
MLEKMVAPELFRPPLDLPDASYDHLLRTAAKHNPDRIAIIYHNLRFTYREVVSMVNSIANGLHDLGLQKGDRLCLFMANRPEYIITFIAAASLGIVITPMNPTYKEREIAYQLENSEADALLVQRELAPLIQLVKRSKALPHLKHILVTGASSVESLPEALPYANLLRQSSPRYIQHTQVGSDDLLALPYSSGTTGLPKGTMLTHRNLIANHLQFLSAWGIDATEIALIFLPVYHIYGAMLTGSMLAAGGRQVLMERFDLQQSLELCERHSVTLYFGVPPIILALANAPVDLSKMKSVKYILSGAAPLAPEPARKLATQTGINVIQGYGMTEASPLTHAQPADPALFRLETVGLPVHNTEQKIVALEDERELPAGEVGEIILRGPQIMQGYWKAPEETARVLRDGWFSTGDIGYIDDEGYLHVVDRKKEMIKHKGFSVAPAELEALLLEHPAVIDAAAIGVADDEAGELIKGFVVLRPGQTITPDELLAYCNGKLAGYKKFQLIEIIGTIPKNASGKILRRELKERELARRQQLS